MANLELRISPRIFEKFRNGHNGILRGLGEMKKTRSRKSRDTVPVREWICVTFSTHYLRLRLRFFLSFQQAYTMISLALVTCTYHKGTMLQIRVSDPDPHGSSLILVAGDGSRWKKLYLSFEEFFYICKNFLFAFFRIKRKLLFLTVYPDRRRFNIFVLKITAIRVREKVTYFKKSS